MVGGRRPYPVAARPGRTRYFGRSRCASFTLGFSGSASGGAPYDLAVRSAQAYFDVLTAQDTLALVSAQKAATSEQLAQAKRNFEVGTATITDTHEAQSRYDLIVAQEIAAQNDLENRRRALQLIAGKPYAELKPLRADVRLAPPNPDNMETWVDLAEKQSYPVLIQESGTEIAALEAKRTQAGHYPTLDLVGNAGYTTQDGSQFSSIGSELTSASIGLQLAVPIYQGGGIRPGALEWLYELIKEREPEINISHRQLPTFEQHRQFVTRRPYRFWYLIERQAEGKEEPVWIGYISATGDNEIGIVLRKPFRGCGFGPMAIRLLTQMHRPNPAEPGVRNGAKNRPFASVTKLRAPCSDVMVTVAPGTAAPWLSTTSPVSEPEVVSWAEATPNVASTSASAQINCRLIVRSLEWTLSIVRNSFS